MNDLRPLLRPSHSFPSIRRFHGAARFFALALAFAATSGVSGTARAQTIRNDLWGTN
jgi:hypothetical protein